MTRRAVPAFVLASGSAGRLRVLRDAGIDPEVMVSGAGETDEEGLDTATLVAVLAERKAAAVARQRPDALVLGCDSMLDLDGAALGKPASPGEATAMWHRLAGRQATLFTGHCLVAPAGRRVRDVAATAVRFGTPRPRFWTGGLCTGGRLRPRRSRGPAPSPRWPPSRDEGPGPGDLCPCALPGGKRWYGSAGRDPGGTRGCGTRPVHHAIWIREKPDRGPFPHSLQTLVCGCAASAYRPVRRGG